MSNGALNDVLRRMTPALPLLLIGSGALHAVLQEELMHMLGGRIPLVITSFEFGCCSTLSLLWLLFSRADPFDVPRGALLRISALVLSSLVSGNLALRWVSYPVKVVIKSCKLLPTMALGSFLLKRRYNVYDQLAALCLCGGLVGFTLGDRLGGGDVPARAAAPSSPFGVLILLFAVSCDAVQVLLSERMLRGAPHLTPMHVMLYTNGFAFFAVVAGIWLTGEHAHVQGSTLPWVRLIVYGSCSWVGVCCFIALTRSWGATAAVVMTNVRKLVSVVLSFVLFPKPLRAAFAFSAS